MIRQAVPGIERLSGSGMRQHFYFGKPPGNTHIAVRAKKFLTYGGCPRTSLIYRCRIFALKLLISFQKKKPRLLASLLSPFVSCHFVSYEKLDSAIFFRICVSELHRSAGFPPLRALSFVLWSALSFTIKPTWPGIHRMITQPAIFLRPKAL